MADDLEIELADDALPVTDDVVVVEAPAAAASVTEDPTEALRALREQLDTEKTARTGAERRASEAAAAAHAAKVEAQDSNLSLVTNAIDTIKQNDDILTQRLAEAMAAQDFEGAAQIQRNMSTNAARLMQLENGKMSLENAPKLEEPKPYINSDPVEALASLLSPRSAAWVRAHPEYATDPKLNRKMLAAHSLAIADDVVADSDDYFAAIETTLRIREAEPAEAAPQRRSSAPPAAPVTRGAGGGATTNRGNRVTLSQAEREMADMMGMTVQEYGRNKLELQKEGKLH